MPSRPNALLPIALNFLPCPALLLSGFIRKATGQDELGKMGKEGEDGQGNPGLGHRERRLSVSWGSLFRTRTPNLQTA